MSAIDVISVSSSDGELRPLRIRAAGESGELFRGNIMEILNTKENRRIGAEARFFLCRVQIEGRSVIMELKYNVRNLSWQVIRSLYEG